MRIFQRQSKEEYDGLNLVSKSVLLQPDRKKIHEVRVKGKASNAGVKRKGSVAYGIQDAIELMRNLPSFNQKVIVSVVKQTLESADIQVSDIIVDGEFQESAVELQIDALSTEVKKFRDEISERNKKIETAESILDEIVKVKDLLKLAQQSQIKENLSKLAMENLVLRNDKSDNKLDVQDACAEKPGLSRDSVAGSEDKSTPAVKASRGRDVISLAKRTKSNRNNSKPESKELASSDSACLSMKLDDD